ncbi:MAG: hypothetical protein WEA04_01515 [Candidatus Andersenbacteria bacterium]
MTLGSFFLGLALMIIGFLCVRKTDALLRYFGDISEVFGLINAQWISWKVFGVALMIVGFMVAFGLLQAFLILTIGRLFNFSV